MSSLKERPEQGKKIFATGVVVGVGLPFVALLTYGVFVKAPVATKAQSRCVMKTIGKHDPSTPGGRRVLKKNIEEQCHVEVNLVDKDDEHGQWQVTFRGR